MGSTGDHLLPSRVASGPWTCAPFIDQYREATLAHSSRTWTGARTPQALKRVRQSAARRVVLQPRRSAAKTLVAKAIASATTNDAEQTRQALIDAVSALDRAAKVGAIHPNAADRRKSRLMLKLNAAIGGEALTAAAKSQRQTGKTAAAKAAKARIAAGRAQKAKGEQTAAGKARAALSRSSRETAAAASAERASDAASSTKTAARSAAKPATKASTAKSTASKPAATKTAAKATSTAAKSATTTKAGSSKA